jgi:hypothetical protein
MIFAFPKCPITQTFISRPEENVGAVEWVIYIFTELEDVDWSPAHF